MIKKQKTSETTIININIIFLMTYYMYQKKFTEHEKLSQWLFDFSFLCTA